MATRRVTLDMKGGGALEKKLLEIAKSLGNGHAVNVGILAGATYPDGLPVAQAGFWLEFGTKKMPPRSFIRSTVAEKSPGWPASLARIAKQTNYNSRQSMALMGEGIKGQIQHTINTLTEPPLAQSTIDAKGHSKPLIDSAVLLRSIDYEVVARGP